MTNHPPAAMTITSYSDALHALVSGTKATAAGGALVDLQTAMDRAAEMIAGLRERRKKVMLVGNGGSSSIVAHVHNDLAKADRVRAMVFTEPALLTALANDISYAAAYEFLVKMWAENGDILMAVSSSGKSENIVRTAAAAKSAGCGLITFTGFSPTNPLRAMGDLNFYVAADHYGLVETAHAALTHYLTDRLIMRP